MRVLAWLALCLVAAACGGKSSNGNGNGNGDPDAGTGADACVGIGCNVTDCRAQSKPDTTISGTVFAPNGTLPLYGINVYVPATDPGPLASGATCARCSDDMPGNPVVSAISDANGHFSLIGVPNGDNIPLVITSGKWRRIVTIPHIDACTEVALPAASTALPKDHTEGDMPQIAITTGAADSLECLVRKLGIADSEITTDRGAGRVHLYQGNLGKDQFKVGFPGGSGEVFSEAETLWSDLEKMKTYDIMFFSCEGAQYPEYKSQDALDAVRAYADFGGRVFMSHWHNIWIEGSIERGIVREPAASWKSLGTWPNNSEHPELPKDSYALIDEVGNPKGGSFADWMQANGGSTERGKIVLQNQAPDPDEGNQVFSTGRSSLATIDTTRAERWVYLPPTIGNGGTQNFQFTTPIEEADEANRCGKVVFSDMHVSGTSGDGLYPDSCGSNDMTPQEKALAFMFFDIASCVGILL